jgi:hypothetical protein
MTNSDYLWLGVLFLAAAVAVYLLPGIIASHRNHHQKVAIWVLNIFGGWTGFGWVGALVWAFTNPSASSDRTVVQVSREVPTQAPVDVAAEIERFAKLHTDGLLTEEEFTAKKKKLLGLEA